jgi:carbonic anhydrase
MVRADEALKRLMEGNARYVRGELHFPRTCPQTRADAALAQSPFAVIVGCSDSRVPAEFVFDQGIGDLFVIRTAGHRIDSLAIASVEYAVSQLRTRLVMVLGHQRCGAVAAALDWHESPEAWKTDESPVGSNHMPQLLEKLRDVVDRTRPLPGDHLDNAVRENVKTVMRKLVTSSSVIQEGINLDGVQVVGAYYSLDDGTIQLMDTGAS